MLTPSKFDEQVAALAAANGLSIEIAGHYMALIGDTPELDDRGKLLVRDDNDLELARLTAPAAWDLAIPA